MVSWFIPAVKAVLPYISPIVSAAMPVFTTRKANQETAAQINLMQQQIAELQTAASANAAHIKELAEQLQKTVTALEYAADDAGKRFKRMMGVCVLAVLLALAAVVIGVTALLHS